MKLLQRAVREVGKATWGGGENGETHLFKGIELDVYA